jgi:hypothetical protein
MRKRLSILTGVALFSAGILHLSYSADPPAEPLRVIKQAGDVLSLAWQMPALQKTSAGSEAFSRVSFTECDFSTSFGNFALPYKTFSVGIPANARISYEISDIIYETLTGIILAPPLVRGRDKNGLSIAVERSASEPLPSDVQPLIEISEQVLFRDLPLVHISFYPLHYDEAGRQLRVIKSATLTFKFSEGNLPAAGMISRSRIDYLYDKIVLNFTQAKQWLAGKPKALRKPGSSYPGPWYRIEVNTDGLHRINYNTLSTAGITPADIDPRTLKIYNHGGFPLDVDTRNLGAIPEGPRETAIYVAGEEDGRFDSNDHILFYGKGAGGWEYPESGNEFSFTSHPYDSKNYYWLTFGGVYGKRMQTANTPVSGATASDSYFIERIHFEEDKYNLLASGTDWYGYRFYGLSHDVSINYTLNNLSKTPRQARMSVNFKGGSGLKYRDDDPYRYNFSGWINPTKAPSALFSGVLLREESSIRIDRNFVSTDYLQEGTNALYIQYTGNFENCNAYLDWVEFYYPRDFIVKNNQLVFYTNTSGQIVAYTISGFTETDLMLFDITDPVECRRLLPGSSVQSGQISFNLDLRDGKHKRLLLTSAQSTEITQVGTLILFQPEINLMDPSLSGDLLIITHPSFRSYAQEIVDLRSQGSDPVNGKVISLDDIYFYFASGVKDPVAIRNFIRYAYYNWSPPRPSYVLLFGDGHYDYRNLVLPDTNRVPPYEISANLEIDSRESDNFLVDVNFSSSTFSSIQPDLAVGRLPAESAIDARRMVDKLKSYAANEQKDGWQTLMTFVADDEVTSSSSSEWFHQSQTDAMAELSELDKFLKRKIYLSAYESVPGGFGRVKPEANQAIIDQLNEGTLLINYAGHGSPTAWAHESALSLSRDLKRIQNEGRLPLWIAATCDFGKYDDPHDPSFTEALVWEEERGAIAVVSSSRLVYAFDNSRFNTSYLRYLFPGGAPSRRLGEALLLSTQSIPNDQKYHLFGDPSMYLADPRGHIQITGISPDTLKALSKVTVIGYVTDENSQTRYETFNGGAFLIVNDALYDSVNTGGPGIYTKLGPRIFKGEISVGNGLFSGEFIVPKSIRYHDQPTGRLTVFAWNEEGPGDAIGYVDTLLFMGSTTNLSDGEGPEIRIFFDGQEDFRAGDMVKKNTMLVARLFDESGINLTQEVGHKIEITIDDQQARDITSFFAYNRNSYSQGQLSYHLDDLSSGEHRLKLQAWDNLNNPTRSDIDFKVVDEEGLVLQNVVNYPNPFDDETNFTFQVLGTALDTEVKIKIYTVTGRLIRSLEHIAPPVDGFNYYPWDGRDDDGDIIANGVYLYKVIVKNSDEQKEVIEKLVVLR